MKTINKLWLGIIILVLLSPLGLLLPERLKAQAAWGEWGIDEVNNLVGYVPRGLKKLASLWNSPLPDYAFKGWEERGLSSLSFAYIISAIVGIIVVVAVIYLLAKFLIKNEK
jgi:hypothetical protein